MPEAAETRLTVDFLNRSLQNRKITEWVFTGGGYTDESPEGYDEFDAALPLTVLEVDCKGKFIYFTLIDDDENEYYIFHSLRMTGRWQKIHDEYCKWFVEIDNGQTLWFRDPRSFATVKFSTSREELDEKLDSLGPDIMKPEFTLPLFKSLAKKYAARNICSFLMDQSVISGCGNYIKAESLYDAKISPLRKIGNLSENEVEILYQALTVIPRISYNKSGVSLRDYADENGRKGSYEGFLKVYGNVLATRTKTSDGRNTYWFPDIQK